MADPRDDDGELERLLGGWGTPEPRAGFDARVLARIDGEAAARTGARKRWALAFVLGGVFGGLVVGAVASWRMRPEPDGAPSSPRRIHLQAPGVAEVIGEPGSQLSWQRPHDGRVVLELREGTAWVRHIAGGPALGVVAGGEEVTLGGPCGRIVVVRGLLGVDVDVDDVACERVDAAIERVRAELSDEHPR